MSMDDSRPERLKKFESALGDPINKFTPKPDPTVAALIEQLRAHARGISELCDQAETAINASEDSARKAADNLMDLIKRVK
jgi:hypothetical protein